MPPEGTGGVLAIRRSENLVAEAAHFFAVFGGLGRGRNRADLHQVRTGLLFEHLLAVEFHHALVFLRLFELGVAGAGLLFTGILGDAQAVEIVLDFVGDNGFAQDQGVFLAFQLDGLAAGKNLVLAVLLIPFREGRGHVHLLDDVAPADAGIVGAEGDLAFLGGVGDDALFGAAEIVIEEILKPHTGDEEEVPAIAAALLDVVHGAVFADRAVVLAGGAEGLVELLHEIA